MRWSRSELLEKIRLGEDTFLELKEVKFAGGKVRGPAQDALADELAAFANASGGSSCSASTTPPATWLGCRSIDSTTWSGSCATRARSRSAHRWRRSSSG